MSPPYRIFDGLAYRPRAVEIVPGRWIAIAIGPQGVRVVDVPPFVPDVVEPPPVEPPPPPPPPPIEPPVEPPEPPEEIPVPIAFPPRNETADFITNRLEPYYRDVLMEGARITSVNAEGYAVWSEGYLRRRVKGMSHQDASDDVIREIKGEPTTEPPDFR